MQDVTNNERMLLNAVVCLDFLSNRIFFGGTPKFDKASNVSRQLSRPGFQLQR